MKTLNLVLEKPLKFVFFRVMPWFFVFMLSVLFFISVLSIFFY